MSEFKKIKIPMIRNILPNLFAQEIVGIQPMTFGTLNEFILYNNHPKLEIIMNTVHTAIRPFMRPGDEEPNEHYRPWMEEHIGEQGVDWNWRIHTVVNNQLVVDFVDEEKATLFELTWP